MTIPEEPSSAVDLLSRVNGNAYHPVTEPYGMAKGGHKVRWTPAANAIAAVSNWIASVTAWISDTAAQVAADAASAAAGSGTESTVANIRSGLTAMYLSIRRVYDANAPVALTDAPSIAWDMATGINFEITLGAAGRALANPTNKVAGKSGILRVMQDATGNRTITTWGTDYIWIGGEPYWPTAANARSVIIYLVGSDGRIELTFSGSSA